MRLAIALAVGLAIVGCKKKKAVDQTAATAGSGSAVAAAPLPPIPAAAPGPAYVMVIDHGIARLEPEGWKIVAPMLVSSPSLSLGGDGTLWAAARTKLWKLAGDDPVEQPAAPGDIQLMSGAVDGTLWVTIGGKLFHFTGTEWVPGTLPGTDPVRGLVTTNKGLWISTLDRTYRFDGERWTPYDVPGVTGGEVDILSIDARGDDAYLVTTKGIDYFARGAWRILPLPDDFNPGSAANIVAGPAGRFGLADGYGKKHIGDVANGLRDLDMGDMPSATWWSMDDRGRFWIAAQGTIAVYDDAGKVVKKWTHFDTPVLDAYLSNLLVLNGGPAHLDAGERAAGTVVGKVEGSAAGLKVIGCAQSTVNYGKDPCDTFPNARSTTTTAGGQFKLDGVSIGPVYFYVMRGGRWRETEPTGCCDKLLPDGTIDVGTLTLR